MKGSLGEAVRRAIRRATAGDAGPVGHDAAALRMPAALCGLGPMAFDTDASAHAQPTGHERMHPTPLGRPLWRACCGGDPPSTQLLSSRARSARQLPQRLRSTGGPPQARFPPRFHYHICRRHCSCRFDEAFLRPLLLTPIGPFDYSLAARRAFPLRCASVSDLCFAHGTSAI